MNQGYFELPEIRQRQIENAGYRVFAENGYRKAPMSEIAAEAGISKSLLFYHFKNKKELYLYLWNKSIQYTRKELGKMAIMEKGDFFDMMELSLRGKCEIMRNYPYLMDFSMKAYYEKDAEVHPEIQKSFGDENRQIQEQVLKALDRTKIREEIDLEMMYREIIWASDGFLRERMQQGAGVGKIDPDQMESDYEKLIIHWRQVYERGDDE